MPFAEDLTPYFADYGEDGTLAGVAVRGIFDAPAAQQLGGVGMAAEPPQFTLPTASVPADNYGLALVLDRGSYTVREHVPDGTGLSILLLTEAAP